jgi:hypothetical protein
MSAPPKSHEIIVAVSEGGEYPHDSRSLVASHLLLKLAGDAFRNCTKVRTVHIVRSVHKLNQKLTSSSLVIPSVFARHIAE